VLPTAPRASAARGFCHRRRCLRRQQETEPLPDCGVVVNQQDPDRRESNSAVLDFSTLLRTLVRLGPTGWSVPGTADSCAAAGPRPTLISPSIICARYRHRAQPHPLRGSSTADLRHRLLPAAAVVIAPLQFTSIRLDSGVSRRRLLKTSWAIR